MCITSATAENGTAWEFFLYINNQTPHTLTMELAHLDWGVWYLDHKDDTVPIDIKPGESVQALGIRAAHGTCTGYECHCRWSYNDAQGRSRYNIDLHIDVPYIQDNSASVTSSGPIEIEEWEVIPAVGHNFTRKISVSEIYSPDPTVACWEKTMDSQEKRFYDLQLSNNELIRDWSKLQSELQEIKHVDPSALLPDQYYYPPCEMFVGRTTKNIIRPELWPQLQDPNFKFEWQKRSYVEEYFTVAIYSYNTNPRSTINVPRGVNTVTETSVEVASSIQSTLETNQNIRALLKLAVSALTVELESTYAIKNVMVKSSSRIQRTTQTVTIGASDQNRLFVPWIFSTTIAVYRRTKDKKTDLIAVSEWADEILDKVYEYNG